jgi:hypothetical protein
MFCYTVTATLASQAALQPYIEWLNNGHIQALLPWAFDAQVIILEPLSECELPQVQSCYRFPSRTDFELYQKEGAPKLQAEGKELARQLGGISFTRTWGTQVAWETRPSS